MRLRLGAGIVLLALLAGCGGGLGGGTGGGGGGGNGGGTISDDQRSVVMASAGAKFDSLAGLDPAAANQQMADYLKTLPQFEASGVSDDGCAWGRFTDGRVAIFVNNRKTLSGASPLASRHVTTRAADPPSNLPMDTAVSINEILGASFGSPGTYYTNWFAAKQYTPRANEYLDALYEVQNVGLFYIDSHGGSGKLKTGNMVYSIWTKSPVSPFLESKYKGLWDTNQVTYMYAKLSNDADGNPINEWHYAITAKFVMEHMSFGKNSMVYIDACSSDNGLFKTACFAKGASVYVGWTAPVDSGMAMEASERIFDRLLGLNAQGIAENPKQRPFDWKSVFAWLQENGFDRGQAAGGCYLTMTPNPQDTNGFGLFSPSIMYVWAHTYEGKLYLFGLFGENPGADGQVTVDGTSLAVEEWAHDSNSNMDRIVATLPYEGAGSSGDVKVTVRKHESNVRQLSFYRGDVRLTHDCVDGRKFVITHHLRFRVDLQSARMKPGEAPKFSPMNPQRIWADDKSTGEWACTGTTQYDDGTIQWSGSGDLVNNINGGSSAKSFIASIWFDPANKKARISLSGVAQNGLTQLITDKNGNTATQTSTIIWGNDEYDGKTADAPPYVEFTLNSDYSLPKTSRDASKIIAYYSTIPLADKLTIDWDAIQCQHPPKDDSGRAALAASTRRR